MSAAGSADRGERAARRTLLLFGSALVVLAVAVAVSAWRDDGSAVVDGGDGRGRVFEPVLLGPAEGVPVAAYLDGAAERRARDGSVVGIVSFAEYQSLAAVGDLTDGIDVEAVLVCLVSDRPAVVRGDVARWESERRTVAAADLVEIESLLPTVEDIDFARFYVAERRRLDRMLESETDAVVFGFVGRADAATFRARGADPAVRLVDLFDGARLDDVHVRGVRPEEVTTTGQPPYRP